MSRALERQREGSARVIPVILEPCDWHLAPFGKLLAVPKDGKAVTTWPNQAEAWSDITRQIRAAIEEMPCTTGKRATLVGGSAGLAVAAAHPTLFEMPLVQPAQTRPRSSNLRLKKEFTDFDRDKFLHDTFDYMAKFFDASLEELAARNEGIQVRFQRFDVRRFTAVAYRGGAAVAECSVRIEDYGRGSTYLVFSNSANAPEGGSSGMLSIESDTQSMYFKAMGMFHLEAQNSQMSEQGASEFFWALFIEGLQS
jgi:hypothetical protein